ncbi:short-chain dehydrogenase, partial [Burkholderia contaminans]|nr:short-chain dehydrogenase [Burkholderia contaminans]
VAILDLDAGNGARVADALGERAMFVGAPATQA